MANEKTLKNERIIDTSAAAGQVGTKADYNTVKKDILTSPELEPKNPTVRAIFYPFTLGVLGGFIGLEVAKRMNKDKKYFVIGGVVSFGVIGFLLYKNWEKKNIK